MNRKKLRGDRNQCAGCGEYFNSSHAFEKHRTGQHGVDRRCLTVAEMKAAGMHCGDDGFWRGSVRPVETISRSPRRPEDDEAFDAMDQD